MQRVQRKARSNLQPCLGKVTTYIIASETNRSPKVPSKSQQNGRVRKCNLEPSIQCSASQRWIVNCIRQRMRKRTLLMEIPHASSHGKKEGAKSLLITVRVSLSSSSSRWCNACHCSFRRLCCHCTTSTLGCCFWRLALSFIWHGCINRCFCCG